MKRECDECGREKAERHFDAGMTVCKSCVVKMEEEAVAYAEKETQRLIDADLAKKAAQREKNARTEDRRERDDIDESNRTAERQKAPPREYPYPWRRTR